MTPHSGPSGSRAWSRICLLYTFTDPERRKHYTGPVTTDRYGRRIPKQAHGTANLGQYSSSAHDLMEAVSALYDRIMDPALLVRRLSISANHLVDEVTARQRQQPEQLDLFTDYAAQEQQRAEQDVYKRQL